MSLTRHQYSIRYSDLTAAFTVSTSPIKVTSMLFANNSASAVTVTATTGDAATTLFVVRVPLNASVAWNVGSECYFPDGLAFNVGANTTHIAVIASRAI